jgi:hypothetical protein
MKLTKTALKKIIKEELQNVINEQWGTDAEELISINNDADALVNSILNVDSADAMAAIKTTLNIPGAPTVDEIISAALSARDQVIDNPELQQKLEIVAQMVKEMGINPLGKPEEPTKRYLGMSVRYLKRRGWKWNHERQDFEKRGKLLKPHYERMKKRKKAKKPKQEFPANFKAGDEGKPRPFDEMPD